METPMNHSSMLCFACKKEVFTSLPIQRRDECEHCGADLRVCVNCKFYDRVVYNECRESSADRVKEKDRSNFCDYFTPSHQGASEQEKSDNQLREAAEALFKKKT